uniref:Aldehyde dehydrogenase family protein n=1 Tax=Janibacter limosus TaxID=53458 RepID=A0AC61U649_9MICO|nr:aldehyde dehydrogenase family protein [Janibacter limosus]
MSEILESYAGGRWVAGTGEGREVRDAVTGETVTRVSSEGIDLGGVVAHAKAKGGPSLRAMTFPERAAALKAAAGAVQAGKDRLYELSAQAGCTARDAAVDVDGGIGTAMVYSSLGRKGLPDGTVIVEDDFIQLGKEGVFGGRHVLTSPHGLSLQINAFNFPVWGMLEKLAPALLAGVPTIVKPATPTAHIAVEAVRMMIESGALPEGALQIVAGSIPGLFDELGGRDHIGFTGSADTAAMLRGDAAVTRRSAHFNAEADSLNASVLGPDAVPGEPEFDLFVKALVTEMTVKAGQKCTAIRRALVPAAQMDAVAEAVAARPGGIGIGAPGAEGCAWAPSSGPTSVTTCAPPRPASRRPGRSSTATSSVSTSSAPTRTRAPSCRPSSCASTTPTGPSRTRSRPSVRSARSSGTATSSTPSSCWPGAKGALPAPSSRPTRTS